ncbi:hypothetical protein D8Y22_05935 [Salinadaptatus halalkaliphilus]|uniref:Uncharacterized protein n=1 Tax=Salinadaptatus halalkaliphilus TaxID=2419781 RepID=A0A4S3TSU1_9EURY|nr:hypothetical protein [Salinadaptatus halalkaliphilus]THE65708.1 hypothetical protein D8Y22_05935 [Salinadaptatus halalkaliphilus]
MISRRLAALLTLTLLAVSLVGLTDVPGDPAPELTVESEDDDTYYVSAYTVADADAAGYLNFEVTTADGDRRLVTLADLVWPRGHQNVRLVDDVGHQEIVVEPDETVTTTLENWEHGEMTIYVVERGADRTHESTRTIDCGNRGQEHRITLEDGGGGGGHTCASDFGWVLG